MKFPSALCGTWTLIFTNHIKFHKGTVEIEIDYEQIKLVSENEIFPFVNIQNQKKGYITKISEDSQTNRIIWNKERQYTLKTPIFPSIIIPRSRKKIRGQRFSFKREEERWLSINTQNNTYTFRKNANPSSDDFPAFHKLLITQLILTEIINGIIDQIKLIHLDNIFMGITSIHI
tara:strand:+ start:6328 stop:6852 length:525 start_codon:yes stop_codon:yes gene_type:complete